MKTGFLGTFVTPWSQTETDGQAGLPIQRLRPGATWRYSGELLRVDGPSDVMVLTGAVGMADLHKRAARKVQRMVAAICASSSLVACDLDKKRSFARAEAIAESAGEDALLPQHSFAVTDGRDVWMGSWIETAPGEPGLLMFVGAPPPADQELWITRAASFTAGHLPAGEMPGGGVICFTAGTRIATPAGPRPVEDLREGDLVQTADDGPQPLIWCGARRMTGARLFAMPHLRPLRIRAGVLGPDIPDGDLLVSPNHRMVIRGASARALFNTPEVLVRARDLQGMRGVRVDTGLSETTYVHLLLERHQILFANGLPTESFHPSEADMGTLDANDRRRLFGILPSARARPDDYGPPARRCLTGAETAILRHDSALAA